MKKLLLICICAAILISSVACSGTDYDISKKDNIYEYMSEYIANPDKYAGKSVTLRATCVPVYNFSQNKIARYSVVVHDDDSDMRAVYEIRSNDKKYPKSGSVATLSGVFTEGYIMVSEFKEVTYDERKVDVEAITRNADELKSLIETYSTEYEQSKYYGKTVRIYGNLAADGKGHYALFGFDKNGAIKWQIELKAKDSSVIIPEVSSEYINAYEIVGAFGTYEEDHIVYPCITVNEITPVEGVLYVEGTETQFPMTNPFN